MRKNKKKDRDEIDDRDWPVLEAERLYEADAGKTITEVVRLDVASDLHVSEDLDTELRQQAKLYAWYATLKEEARDAMERAKYQLQVSRDDAYMSHREAEGDIPKTKRLSETQMKVCVNRDKRVRAAEELVMQRSSDFRILEEHCEALKQRSRLLQSLNANRNSEYNDPR